MSANNYRKTKEAGELLLDLHGSQQSLLNKDEVGLMLNDRKRKILQIIIEDYIETAEPVGSRTIARKHNLGLSPATIRNEMSDLELLGYLEQPHTSAGRVPSAQAYRLYVDSMKEEPGALTENDIALINSW